MANRGILLILRLSRLPGGVVGIGGDDWCSLGRGLVVQLLPMLSDEAFHQQAGNDEGVLR